MFQYFKDIYCFWLWVVEQFIKDKCFARASGLTFTSLLAIVPLAVVMFSIISKMSLFHDISEDIQTFIFNNFVPHSGQVVQKYIQDFESKASSLPIIGIVFLIVVSLLMMINIESNITDIWLVRYRRNITWSLLLYWCILTIGPILISASLLLSSYLGSLHLLHGINLTEKAKLLILLPPACIFLAIFLLYVVVPHTKVMLKHAAIGALVSTILFEIARKVFVFYVAYFPTYELLYGALAVIPLFFVWLYVSWLIFLFGAEVVNGLRFRQAKLSSREEFSFMVAYSMLKHIYTAGLENKGLSLDDILTMDMDCNVLMAKQVLRRLESLDLIYRHKKHLYKIKSDLTKLTLYEFIDKLEYYVPISKPNNIKDQNLAVLLAKVKLDWQQAFRVKLADLFS